ncbi:hypothetical protein RFI_16534 [Reticulomyxa filosa]|uniref:Uncharacterized protein n=1 Tax=Reticulomyxa filosa TaxID=46433 RepID=X6N3N0_RETFI|nr:hypothetical protein RFI_16534 [Reticulomyxa filosa]|eukprot:ETO20686.1 hypothetical protein RFI_16534 [Reticulomyxa filosa]
MQCIYFKKLTNNLKDQNFVTRFKKKRKKLVHCVQRFFGGISKNFLSFGGNKMTRMRPLLLLALFVIHCGQSVKDWLLNDIYSYPNVTLTKCKINDLPCLELSNGLISRKFLISPNFATIEYNTHLQEPYNAGIRAITPEGHVGLNGKTYGVGGIEFKSNITHTYLNLSWITANNVQTNTSFTLQFVSYQTSTTLYKPYEFRLKKKKKKKKRTRHSPKDIPWPPLGLALEVIFAPVNVPIDIQVVILTFFFFFFFKQIKINIRIHIYIVDNIRVKVRYEMLQGMPIMTKMLSVYSLNATDTQNVWLTYMEPEMLCVNPPFSSGTWGGYPNGLLMIDTDIAHSSEIQWFTEAGQSSSPGSMQPCVRVYYAPQSEQSAWAVRLAPELPGTENGWFDSFRVLEVLTDSKSIGDMERLGLAQRRMMKYLTPCVMENPIYVEVTSVDTEIVSRMIDQCNETGIACL